MRSLIWSAVLVHLKGRAVAFQTSIQSSSAVVSSSREQNTPRSTQRRCSSTNDRSTWLIREGAGGREVQLDAGVSQQPLAYCGRLVGGEVVADHVDLQPRVGGWARRTTRLPRPGR
jgi:hypothetical protein